MRIRLIYIFLLLISPVFSQQLIDTRKVDAGDVLEIVLPAAPELSNLYEVDLEGRIFISLIGYVDIYEKTPNEIRQLLIRRLSEFVKHPESMEIKIKEKKKLINVLGFVAKPGTYSVSEYASLQEVLFMAGNALPGALLNKMEIRRKNSGQIQRIGVRYNHFLLTGNSKLLPPLKSGDILFIPKGLKELNTGESLVYIFGAVSRPGTYEITSKTTLLDALSHAGGTNSAANLKDIQIIKNDPGGNRVIQVNLQKLVKKGDVDALPLIENGDTVFVGEKKQHWFLTTIQITASLFAIYNTALLIKSR